MAQTREEIAQNLAERWCWQAARREDSRIARRLYRKQVVDRIYRLDEGALLDDFFCFLNELGVVDLLDDVPGTTVQREMVPIVQYVLLYSLKTLLGIESMNALPALLFSDEALMRLGASMPSRRGTGSANGALRNATGRAPPGPFARMPWPITS